MTIRIPISVLVLAAAALLVHPVDVSAQAPDTTRTYELDPVVVTASQVETPRASLPVSVSVVARREIEASGELSVLPLLARHVPGMFVTERGILGYGVSTGAAGGMTLRGSGGSPNTGVLILTDGRPQMMGLMGHPLPDLYQTANVERVEVIRGPAALLYGTNAVGGVVNIIPRRTSAPGLHVDAGAAAGSFGSRTMEAGVRSGLGQVSLAATANHAETDGHRAESKFRLNGGTVRAGMVLDDHFSLSADGQLAGFWTLDPGTISGPVRDHWVDVVRGSAGFTVENRHGQFEGAFKAFVNFGTHNIYDGFHSVDRHAGLQVYQSVHLAAATVVTVGAAYARYGGAAENVKSRFDFGTFHITETGVYLLVRHDVLDDLTLSGGVRLHRHSLSGTTTIPQAGLSYRLTSSTTLRASVARGFRSPTIRELYLFPAPNPGLLPEDVWTTDLGVVHLTGSSARLEVTGFVSNAKNVIRTLGAYPALRLANSGSWTQRGIESSAEVMIVPPVRLYGTYAYIDVGEMTLANPSHHFALGAQWAEGPFTLSLNMQHVAGLYGADGSRSPLSPYTVFDARGTVTLLTSFSVFVAVENILDRSYQVLTGYPMPGRTVMGGVRCAL